ncbi:putative F-box protein At4g10190 [Papaver somniferum]|uniref:putative F-box protein At4g10190 n=1 Tax=Papaver somniferum TaxID=3469 RepID=UPI000E700451|nr:putative F-box protein At4g10190 [Papaver somniferum]
MGGINCFSLSTIWFKKHRAVDNPRPDHVRGDDNPPPDLTLVRNTLVYNQSVHNPISCCLLPAVITRVAKNRRRSKKKNLLDLPNDIIIDILIKLPAECVLRCQLASKHLEILAKTHFFIRTHLARATSIIGVQSLSQSTDRAIKFYFMDEQAKKVEESNLKLNFCYTDEWHPVMLYDSYDGFLLFKSKDNSSRSIFVIWNPTTEEQVTITMEGLYFQVCGFYFNPRNKEYEVLLQYWARGGDEKFGFDILSFGSKLRRNIGTYSYVPRSERPPTIINGTLYWMVDKILSRGEVNCSNSIMTFEIGTNKLSTMQHGGAPCEAGYNFGSIGYKHDYMHLIAMEGQLGLCVLLSYTEFVLCVLNPATNNWAKAHSVTLPEYTMPEYISCWPNELFVAEVLKIKDGKLLFRQQNRLLLWDLGLNTHKIIEKKGFENDNFRSVIHTPSLVFLDTDKLIQLDK